MSEGTYAFRCNRCETAATDSSRAGVELFSQHHMATMHPLFTKEATTKAFGLPVVKRRRLSSRSVSMCPSRLVRAAR